ncbi:MAG: peptide chain release factor N(5)-glutamine methyltransferase [Eubacterium sp.]|nr:peptide chain release factor N(5)-glutamine methyltransferase [Eubacterium sp.]
MTYRQAEQKGEQVLQQAGIMDAKIDAWLLLEMVAHIDRGFYFMHSDEEIDEEILTEYERVIEKRAEHVPLQYITGEQEFMGMTFKVNSNVLIPRQDTETLVEEALKLVQPQMDILDLCTGSGCILLSILKNAPLANGTGSDISKQALLVAKDNARLHDLEAEWIRSNLFDNISGKFDMIVSNPPYIAQAEIPLLMPEVQQFEPLNALDGGADGLDFYRKIVSEAANYLKENGYLLFEIGYDQGAAVKQLLMENGYIDVSVVKDLAGNDRVVKGRMSADSET